MRRLFLLLPVLLIFIAGMAFANGTSEKGFQLQTSGIDPSVQVPAPFAGGVEGLPKITAPKGFNWKQFAGVKLNVITENTPPSSALAVDIAAFEDVTGITVNIEQSVLSNVVEKSALQANAHTDNYQVVYTDPYQILAKQYDAYVVLNGMMDNKYLPPVPGGLSDFIKSQLEVDGYMVDKTKLLALPYDTPTMVLAYRTDVFSKYRDLFMKENGFDWTPGSNLTWEQYYQIAKWINQKVADGTITEVKYGAGAQAKQYDSLMCDFSNVLSAWGGKYFAAPDLGSYGVLNPGKSLLTSPQAIAAATFYKKLSTVWDPGSTSWDWTGLGNAFAAGAVALAPEWHEFASSFEDPSTSKVVGKVGFAILPKGPSGRSANIFGGTGLSISKYATQKEQYAAWLFLVWATSPQAEYYILQSKVGGETPTRYSVYNLPQVKAGEQQGTPEAKAMPNLISVPAVLQAWEPQNVYMRPKVPQWPQVDTVIYTELSKMLAGNETPQQAMSSAAAQINQITGN